MSGTYTKTEDNAVLIYGMSSAKWFKT